MANILMSGKYSNVLSHTNYSFTKQVGCCVKKSHWYASRIRYATNIKWETQGSSPLDLLDGTKRGRLISKEMTLLVSK